MLIFARIEGRGKGWRLCCIIKVERGIVFIYPFITYHVTRQPVPVHESALKSIAFSHSGIALRDPSSVSYKTPYYIRCYPSTTLSKLQRLSRVFSHRYCIAIPVNTI